jgi:homoserine O-succinyltransferase/O-acetyltransferase
MPLILDTAGSRPAIERRGGNHLSIGLVNNMPDAAWEATERQFLGLIRAAAADAVVCVNLFSIADVPRSDQTRTALAERYQDISELWDRSLDGLIVTGTEPRAADLRDEPYWSSFSELIVWARENTSSTVWSCLAAHAAVLRASGIERRRLENKRFGVFPCEVVGANPLVLGAPPRLRVPQSRYNDVPEMELAGSGYRVLTRSAATGVDTFVKEEPGCSLFVFFQGHPEYEADTLAREYRRDVGRFLRGEREDFPTTPDGYFNDGATAIVEAFRARAIADRRQELILDFPMSALEPTFENVWRRSAVGIYQNWINCLRGRRADRAALMPPTRRLRRVVDKPAAHP